MFGALGALLLKQIGTQLIATVAKTAVRTLTERVGAENAEAIKTITIAGGEALVEHTDTSFDDEALAILKEEVRPKNNVVKREERKKRRNRKRHSDR